ncbi:zona pellucida sperm-binding protein 4-like [Chroicocephalus ridibundus]|uniref:zona pellucida sperm-binding protein 4-like n=1 Tax=Chroicocephalus ridibundus TaxID=1192867 RepID=UPI002FDF05E0
MGKSWWISCMGQQREELGVRKKGLKTLLGLDNTEGEAHVLQNDSECGLLVSGTPDGSRKVLVSYTGCYVFEWDGNYLMLVGLEGTDDAGQKVLHEEKLLRCPVDLPALDAPSSGVCSAVLSQDRLLCASLPISQGDCEERGCCYDPRDRVKPCYFGHTGLLYDHDAGDKKYLRK